MRLPRWLVVGLLSLSVLAVLGAGAWWWVTWPNRKGPQFVEMMAEYPENDAWLDMVRDDIDRKTFDAMYHFFLTSRRGEKPYIERQSRSLKDMIQGRTMFSVRAINSWEFVVERGYIIGPFSSQADIKLQIKMTRDRAVKGPVQRM